jgi:hypothetical protein
VRDASRDTARQEPRGSDGLRLLACGADASLLENISPAGFENYLEELFAGGLPEPEESRPWSRPWASGTG